MPPAELAIRMVTLKGLLVGCDVALLVRVKLLVFFFILEKNIRGYH